MKNSLLVIGAGLSGAEAAWQAAQRGIPTELAEMRPYKKSPAHHTDFFAELVCSNSFRAANVENAVGLLKEEMRRLGSLIMEAADATRVPAGGALAVDRVPFSEYVTEKIKNHPLITITHEEVTEIPEERPCIIASGPLTSDGLSSAITRLTGEEYFHFHDAAAPIVTVESLNMNKVYRAARYGKGGADYLNCPFTEDEYKAFWQALTTAECAELHEFEKDDTVFEVMHRNSYINSPELLLPTLQYRKRDSLFFAGQLTGVEGYLESASMGLLAGINAAKLCKEEACVTFPKETALGALSHYISTGPNDNFQPMNVNFGIISPLGIKKRIKKREKNALLAQRALEAIEVMKEKI